MQGKELEFLIPHNQDVMIFVDSRSDEAGLYKTTFLKGYHIIANKEVTSMYASDYIKNNVRKKCIAIRVK